MLKKRNDKDYSKEALSQTEKFSFLSPDFYTLWNYRREILTEHFTQEEYQTSEAKLKAVKLELDLLLKGISRSPKSYTLWFHRQWIIEFGVQHEAKDDWKSQILEGEFMLCNKFLQRDERNFHCWNYRLWVVETYIQRIKSCTEDRQVLEGFLKKECEMAEQIIKKNFSNYSAWHYRGQLMPQLYERTPGAYVLPIERIQEDLEMLKHAFFTEPNDQSPWNYHQWLISLLTPIQVVGVQKVDEKTFEIGFSQPVRNVSLMQVQVESEGNPLQFTLESKSGRDLSPTWRLILETPTSSFTLQMK